MAVKSQSQNRIRAKLHFFYAILLAAFGLAAAAKLHREEGTEEDIYIIGFGTEKYVGV